MISYILQTYSYIHMANISIIHVCPSHIYVIMGLNEEIHKNNK